MPRPTYNNYQEVKQETRQEMIAKRDVCFIYDDVVYVELGYCTRPYKTVFDPI